MSEFRYHPPPASPRCPGLSRNPAAMTWAAPLASMARDQIEFRPRKRFVGARSTQSSRRRSGTGGVAGEPRAGQSATGMFTICHLLFVDFLRQGRQFPRRPGTKRPPGNLGRRTGRVRFGRRPVPNGAPSPNDAPGPAGATLLGCYDAFMTTSISPAVVSYFIFRRTLGNGVPARLSFFAAEAPSAAATASSCGGAAARDRRVTRPLRMVQPGLHGSRAAGVLASPWCRPCRVPADVMIDALIVSKASPARGSMS
jgi:hypothetical protein